MYSPLTEFPHVSADPEDVRKLCSVCEVDLPQAYTFKMCESCRARYRKRYQKQREDALNTPEDVLRTCSQCGQTKKNKLFPKTASAKCKSCISLRGEKYYVKNYSSIRSKQAQFYVENREQIRASQKAFVNTPEGWETWLRSHKKYVKNNPHKVWARNVLRRAVLKGIIEKQPCIVCGADAHAHHPDYSKPLDVIWLCRRHHQILHNYLRAQNV